MEGFGIEGVSMGCCLGGFCFWLSGHDAFVRLGSARWGVDGWDRFSFRCDEMKDAETI